MARDRIQLPSSIGGIVRYFDDFKSKIELKPGHVIVIAVIIMIIIIVLHVYGLALLGLG